MPIQGAEWWQQPGWWQVGISIAGGALAGFFSGTKLIMNLVRRVDILETKAENDRASTKRLENTLSSVQEGQRESVDKFQRDFMLLREKIAAFPTAAQLDRNTEKILNEIRKRGLR